jgi:hypothetical protein
MPRVAVWTLVLELCTIPDGFMEILIYYVFGLGSEGVHRDLLPSMQALWFSVLELIHTRLAFLFCLCFRYFPFPVFM